MGSKAVAEVFEAYRMSTVDLTNSAPSLIKDQNLTIMFKEVLDVEKDALLFLEWLYLI